MMKCIIVPVNILMIPIHILAPRLPAPLQRIEYKLGTHYLRFFGFPRMKPFVPKSDKVIIFLPQMGWNDMKQRPHHLPRAFSKAGWTAIYITQNVEEDNVIGMRKINENFYLCSSVRILKNIKNPWVYMNYTVNMYLLKYFKEYRLIFDHVDKLEIHTFYTNKMVKEQQKSLKIAKVVTATSDFLRDEIISIRKDTLLIPNAVFPEDFILDNNAPVPSDLLKIIEQNKPIVGYYGIFSEWKIDYDLIQFAAKKLPEINFVMIGPDYDHTLNNNEWDKYTNIYFFGKKKYSELPFYAHHFDVAILPFIVNEVTNAISPVKLFEYFAMKLPVVSTNISESKKYQTVMIANNHEEFVTQIRKALLLKNNSDYQASLQKEVALNTWDYRCEKILDKMNEIDNLSNS